MKLEDLTKANPQSSEDDAVVQNFLNTLNPQKRKLSPQEYRSAEKLIGQSFAENFADEWGSNVAKVGATIGDLIGLGDTDSVNYLKSAIEGKKIQDELKSTLRSGGANNLGGMAADVMTYALPASKVGVVGTGLSSIPKTAATWGAIDGGVSAALGNKPMTIMEDALLAGTAGGLFSGAGRAVKGLDNIYVSARDAATDPAMAGGGTPKEDIIKMYEQQADRTRQAGLTDEFEGTTTKLDDAEGTNVEYIDSEISNIQRQLNDLDKEPYKAIVEANPDTFKGLKTQEAYKLLDENRKLADELGSELEQTLFKKLDELDFVKYGDDRIEVGAKEDLYPAREVDSTQAEQLAKQREDARLAAKEQAEQARMDAEAKTSYNMKNELKELNRAYDAYKLDPSDINLAELDRAMARTSPKKDGNIKLEADEAIDYIPEIGETIAKSDLRAEDAAIGIGTKDPLKKGSTLYKEREAKIAKQREINQRIAKENKRKALGKQAKEVLTKLVDKKGFINIDAFADGRLGQTKNNRVQVKRNVTAKEVLDHIAGDKDSLVSSQKKAVTDLMKSKYNIDLKDIVSKMSDKEAKRFIIEHEKAHIRQAKKYESEGRKLKDEYFKNAPEDNKFMSKEALAIEAAANIAALEKIGKIKLNRKKKPEAEQLAREADEAFPVADKPKPKNKQEAKKPVEKKENVEQELIDDVSKKEIVEKKKLESFSEKAEELFRETKTNFKSSFRTDGDYATYQKIHRQTRDALNVAAKAGADAKEYINDLYKAAGEKLGGKFDTDFSKHVLSTDYVSIREFKTRADAMKFMRENNKVYVKARKYIEQTAKGIKDKGEINHIDFTNNGYQIAQRAGLDPKKYGNTIDKLVSIRAMDSKAWDFVEKNGASNLFDSMVNMVETLRKESDDLFKDNPHARVKGYMSETYDSIYRYEMVNGEFKEFIDAEVGMVQGGLPQKLDNARIGEVKQFPEKIKDMSDKVKLEYAEAHNLGVVLNQYAQPVALRKVASEAQRISIGKSAKASDMIPLTFENSVRKLVQRDTVIQDIVNTPDNTLFSSVEKKGMVRLTDEEKRTIPRELVGKVEFVNPDFKHMLLGNKQIQLAKKQWTKITEQMLKDSVSHFKENVVLKNPASWANNMGYNFFVNMQEGISPAKTIRYMKKGLKEKARAEELVTRLTRLELDGKSGIKEYVDIEKELVDNLYYKMDRQGLAVTVMSNIMDSPIASKRLSDKMMKQATMKILGKDMGEKVSTIVSNLYLSPQSKAGQAAMNMFGSIDAMGRYSMASEQMAKGASLDEAIKKANGIYGDLDMVAPMWSQAIQQYGFIPFSNWYFRMAGGLGKSILENKVKAIGVAALLYGISEATDKRTDSMNPMVTLVETPVDMLQMSPYFNISNYARNVTTPAAYKKGYRAIESGDPLSVALTRDF